MRGYANVRTDSYQYGAPLYKKSRSRKDNGEFGDNFYKMLCSWLNFKDIMSIGPITEVDKIRNVFTSMFQADQKQMFKKHKKTKFKQSPHIVKIDLDKIDKIPDLSNKEKRRLRHILYQIQYKELGKHSNNKDVKRKKEKSVVYRKTKKIVVTENNRGRSRRVQSVGKAKEINSWTRGDCEHCKLSLEKDNLHEKRNQRSCTASITPSEERVFKTLMSLDRSCCGESFKTLFDSKGKRTFITQKQNINIENLQLKYIQPTCLIQCTGMKRGLPLNLLGHPESGIFKKESFQPSAYKVMTKQNNDNKKGDYITGNSFHSTNSMFIDTDKGVKTFKRTRSKCEQDKEGDFSEELSNLGTHFITSKISCQEVIAKRNSEDDDTLLASGDQMSPRSDFEEYYKPSFENQRAHYDCSVGKVVSPAEVGVPGRKKKTSKYKRFKNFAKKYLCFCGPVNDGHKNLSRQRKQRKSRKVKAKLKKKLNDQDAKVVYATEKQFIKRKMEINK